MPEILAADIGGTHSRFAHFTFGAKRPLAKVQSLWLETGRASSFSQLLDSLGATDFGLAPEESDIAVIAVAGPVVAQAFSHPPNIDWDIDLSREPLATRFRRCLLINDFSAQAYACISPAGTSALPILHGEADPGAALAVVGAGTGLGHAALLPLGDGRHRVVPSEGGHASFAFETPPEWEYARFLMRAVGEAYVRAEIVVSGRGLSLVHRFLTGEDLDPADIGPRLKADSPTLAWMARFYGREARNYSLQVLARGGLYIAGGVAAKLPALVTHAAFAEEFRRSPTMSRILDSIPVFLITEEESGLWGAARCGMQLLTGS
jgi:glucokinase